MPLSWLVYCRGFCSSAVWGKGQMQQFLKECLVFSFIISAVTAAAAPANQSNIVLILADDLGWADSGFNGCDASLTPAIDRLASQGSLLWKSWSS
jgi:hypothetical protein